MLKNLSHLTMLLMGSFSFQLPLTATPYSEAILADEPLAYFQFEENSGTAAADSSGHGKNGNIFRSGSLGFGTPSAFPNLGSAFDFRGGYISIPSLGSYSRTSVEAWIQFDSTGSDPCCSAILASNGWSQGKLHLNLAVAGRRLEHAVNGDATAVLRTSEGLTPGTWYHFVITNDVPGRETKFYLNGELVPDTGDHSSQNVLLGGASMQIGAWDGARSFDGRIDELAIYDQALTAAQVLEHYQAASDPGLPDILTFKASQGGLESETGIALPPGGGPVTLTWEIDDAESLQIDNGGLGTTSNLSGSVEVNVTTDTTFTLTATNARGVSSAEVTVFIDPETMAPRLNEFLAKNDDSLIDGNGATSDWIELYNPNPFPLDLAGYQLRDPSSTWTFPAGSPVPALGYLVIFASGNNAPDSQGHLHTNFSLNNSGEALALLREDSSVIDEWNPFPEQYADVSYGPGGYFPTPTPGAANGEGFEGLLDQSDDTQFVIGRGFYEFEFDETITASTPGSSIIYTTDGSVPSESNGTRVDAPNANALPIAIVRIDGSTHRGVSTLRAAVFKEGFLPTNVDTQTYLFTNEVASQSITSARASGWPASSVNGQVFNYGMNRNKIGPGGSSFSTVEISQALEAIPALSIVTEFDNLVSANEGIYVNAQQRGREWERPTSVELIHPDGNTEGFQIDAGLRIRGGYSREPQFFKHGFRLFFRGDYGDSKLRFPLFGTEGADEFDKIDLRSSSNFDWARESDYSLGRQFTFARDVFSRDTQGALGQAYTKTRYYHLYLNGTYWGIYQTEERPEASFGASYFGGDRDDYDTVKCSNHIGGFATEATDGTLEVFEDLWNRTREIGLRDPSNANYFALQGLDLNGNRDPSLPVLLDVDNLIDYMLLIFWTGDGDAVLSNFLLNNRPNNWFGIRNRTGDEGFRFFSHDAEHTLGASTSRSDRTGPFTGSNQNNFPYANPQWMHQDLMANAEYRLRFADRAQKHFFREGALTESSAIARFENRTAQVRPALPAYAARWADARYTPSYNTGLWENEITRITDTWIPGRTATVLGQLRTDDLYPDLGSPVFANSAGLELADGQVSNGFELHLNSPPGQIGGTIYYTLDGSDPRIIGDAVPSLTAQGYTAPIMIDGPTTVSARLFRNGEWSALTEATFHTGTMAPSDQNLVVSQIHYHPLAEAGDRFEGKEYEFLELMNIGSEILDLRNLQLREDINFDFSTGTFLAPGERAQLVANTIAFGERYAGRPIRVLGEYSGNLSNSGGRLHLFDEVSGRVHDFTFDDDAPWPLGADGPGFALVLINPTSNPDPSDPLNWRRSIASHGSPGESDAVQFTGNPAADDDNDGLSALLEHAIGTSDTEPTANPWSQISGASTGGFFEASITRRLNADDVLWKTEISEDLQAWTSLPGQIKIQQTAHPDPNFVIEHYSPANGSAKRTFFRVRVEKR